MPRDAERLLMLTLAIEEALSREAWSEVETLFEERERQIEVTPRIDAANLAAIQAVEVRIDRYLRSSKQAVVDELNASTQGQRAAQAYIAQRYA